MIPKPSDAEEAQAIARLEKLFGQRVDYCKLTESRCAGDEDEAIRGRR
jgi:hypothetical protein